MEFHFYLQIRSLYNSQLAFGLEIEGRKFNLFQTLALHSAEVREGLEPKVYCYAATHFAQILLLKGVGIGESDF